jgi:hypothetical protein
MMVQSPWFERWMMTPEEQVYQFIMGWRAGVALGSGYEPDGEWPDVTRRGFEAGRIAVQVAERVERERAGLGEAPYGCMAACEPIDEEPGGPDPLLPENSLRLVRSIALDDDD